MTTILELQAFEWKEEGAYSTSNPVCLRVLWFIKAKAGGYFPLIELPHSVCVEKRWREDRVNIRATIHLRDVKLPSHRSTIWFVDDKYRNVKSTVYQIHEPQQLAAPPIHRAHTRSPIKLAAGITKSALVFYHHRLGSWELCWNTLQFLIWKPSLWCLELKCLM